MAPRLGAFGQKAFVWLFASLTMAGTLLLFHGKQTGQLKKIVITSDDTFKGVRVRVLDPSGPGGSAGGKAAAP